LHERNPTIRVGQSVLEAFGETVEIPLHLRRKVCVGRGRLTSSDKTDFGFDIGRCTDTLESDSPGELCYLMFVVRQEVRVGQDNGDRSIALVIKSL
jgi:hypothetical protein